MSTQQVSPTVVVGIDGSQSALRAARWGAAEARLRGARLRLVSAFAWEPEHVAHAELVARYRDDLLERAHAQLAEAAAVAERDAPGIEVGQQLVDGHSIPVLGHEARHAQLVVIGDSGLGRIDGLLAGSVAVALAAHAACPVVVVRGAEREPSSTATRPVVVGVDDSPTSEAAIAFAFEAAAARGVRLVAVHTWRDLIANPAWEPLLDLEAIEGLERKLLSERLASWADRYPDVPVERLVTYDRPAHILLEQADRAQLVVVGSRGRGGFTGLVLGSVSHALLHRSPCPVAVVRPDTGKQR